MLTTKFCPRCKSDNVKMIAGGITGSFMCRDCGYAGSIFPEKPVIIKSMNSVKEKRKGDRKKLLK